MTTFLAGDTIRISHHNNAVGTVVGSDTQTTDTGTFTTTPTQIGSVTWPQIDGYTYLIAYRAQLVSTGADVYQATLYEDSTAGTERHGCRTDSRTSDQLRPNILHGRYLHVAVGTGSKTFVITGHRISGAGNVWRDAGTDHIQLMTVTLVAKP